MIGTTADREGMSLRPTSDLMIGYFEKYTEKRER